LGGGAARAAELASRWLCGGGWERKRRYHCERAGGNRGTQEAIERNECVLLRRIALNAMGARRAHRVGCTPCAPAE
jgi:hypothetical protein